MMTNYKQEIGHALYLAQLHTEKMSTFKDPWVELFHHGIVFERIRHECL